jgi:hypothetical protein
MASRRSSGDMLRDTAGTLGQRDRGHGWINVAVGPSRYGVFSQPVSGPAC